MSGTSLDGLDIAFCSFQCVDGRWSFKLKASKSVKYDVELYDKLKGSTSMTGLDLLLLNSDYGKWLGQQTKQFIDDHNIKPDFVASHGHTVFHQPEKGLTYQIGDGQEIANACGLKVICNFRVKDVKLGGQGAPLVPIGDQYLFSDYDFCLNLGGISNISFTSEGKRLAFDIGIANMALNYLARQIGKPYDHKGEIARTAQLNKSLFDQLGRLAYYQEPIPKSTGFEWFHQEIQPILNSSTASIEDKLCTVTHHITHTIAHEINKLASKKARLLITGGGARNNFLIETLRQYLDSTTEIIIPDDSIIEFKEAIVFALMGVLRERGETNCLKSVTGAKVDSCCGEVYLP